MAFRSHYRQGDVVLESCTFPAGAGYSRVKKVTLAKGEKTGHSHVLMSPGVTKDIEIVERDGTLYLRVLGEKPAKLKHQEHDTITVPPGSYKVVTQTEYDPKMGTRHVAD